MSLKNRIWPYLIFAIVFFLLTTSCIKDDDDNLKNTVTDIDGNVYRTIKIGTQVWMAENLKTTNYNDGTPITNVTDDIQWKSISTSVGIYCNYENIESNVATYGRLYNWYAVNTGKLAPYGWHIPTDEEWTILENYVAANLGTSGSVAKALASTISWVSSIEAGAVGNDLTANNSIGFAALPAGCVNSGGKFFNKAKFGYWWTSSEGRGSDHAFNRSLSYNSKYFNRTNTYYRDNGFSIRCIKDELAN